MGTMPPNHQKLIVTGKNKQASDYGKDMREIEMWANEGIVRSLHAGSGITLNPTDGVDTGTGITINATGGGGGTSVGYLIMYAGPDDALIPNQVVWTGIGGNPEGSGIDLQSFIPLFSNATGSDVLIAFGSGWLAKVAASDSAALLPEFTAPTFTGGPIIISCEINAANAAFNQFAMYQNGGISFTSGEDYQFLNTDFTGISSGGDLTMTAGSGNSGNGLVSAAGGVYWGGIAGYVTIPTGTTFT